MSGGWAPLSHTPAPAQEAGERKAAERDTRAAERAAEAGRQRGLRERLLRMYSRSRRERPPEP